MDVTAMDVTAMDVTAMEENQKEDERESENEHENRDRMRDSSNKGGERYTQPTDNQAGYQTHRQGTRRAGT